MEAKKKLNVKQWTVSILGLAVAATAFVSLSHFRYTPGTHSVSRTVNRDKSINSVDKVIGPTFDGTAPFEAFASFAAVLAGTILVVVKMGRRSTTQGRRTSEVGQSSPDIWPPAPRP